MSSATSSVHIDSLIAELRRYITGSANTKLKAMAKMSSFIYCGGGTVEQYLKKDSRIISCFFDALQNESFPLRLVSLSHVARY